MENSTINAARVQHNSYRTDVGKRLRFAGFRVFLGVIVPPSGKKNNEVDTGKAPLYNFKIRIELSTSIIITVEGLPWAEYIHPPSS